MQLVFRTQKLRVSTEHLIYLKIFNDSADDQGCWSRNGDNPPKNKNVVKNGLTLCTM